MRTAIIVLTIGVSSAVAHAGSLDLLTEQIDPGSVLPNHVANRVLIDFTDTAMPPSLRGQQMIVQLSQGSIYQDPQGGLPPPNQVFIDAFPTLEFDTFVAMCGDTAGTSLPVFVIGGSPPINPFPTFPSLPSPLPYLDETELNIAWAPGTGVNVPPMAEPCLTAQVTLSDDAEGSWWYFSSTADGTTGVFNNLRIENGMMLSVPEPPTAALVSVASVAILVFIRRNARTRVAPTLRATGFTYRLAACREVSVPASAGNRQTMSPGLAPESAHLSASADPDTSAKASARQSRRPRGSVWTTRRHAPGERTSATTIDASRCTNGFSRDAANVNSRAAVSPRKECE